MRKQKFKEKCEVCGKFTDDYNTSTGKIVCKQCMGLRIPKKELEKPAQTTIYDFLYKGM